MFGVRLVLAQRDLGLCLIDVAEGVERFDRARGEARRVAQLFSTTARAAAAAGGAFVRLEQNRASSSDCTPNRIETIPNRPLDSHRSTHTRDRTS